jgi:hypothetical protein
VAMGGEVEAYSTTLHPALPERVVCFLLNRSPARRTLATTRDERNEAFARRTCPYTASVLLMRLMDPALSRRLHTWLA